MIKKISLNNIITRKREGKSQANGLPANNPVSHVVTPSKGGSIRKVVGAPKLGVN